MFQMSLQRIGMIAIFISFFTFTGCGDDDGTTPPQKPLIHTIGGTVTGVTGTLVIRNQVDGKNYDELTITSNGAFEFDKKVADKAQYAVVPLSFPVGQVCTFTNPSGTAKGNVTTVEIECN